MDHMIVLDTHASWLWWLDDPARLSAPAQRAIDGATMIGICTLSALELATLTVRGRISLDRDGFTGRSDRPDHLCYRSGGSRPYRDA